MQNLDAARDPIVWLEYAAEDIRVVRKCLSGDDYTLRSAIYHAQQAAEKSLKAFLVLHKQPVPKVYALMLLLQSRECPGLCALRLASSARALIRPDNNFKTSG